MRATGIVRSTDDLGRLVIPKELCEHRKNSEIQYEFHKGEDGVIILKPYKCMAEIIQVDGEPSTDSIIKELQKLIGSDTTLMDWMRTGWSALLDDIMSGEDRYPYLYETIKQELERLKQPIASDVPVIGAMPQYLWDRIRKYLEVGLEAAQDWEEQEEIDEINEVLHVIDNELVVQIGNDRYPDIWGLQSDEIDDSGYGPDDVYTLVELVDEDGGVVHKGEKCTVMDISNTVWDDDESPIDIYELQVDNDGRAFKARKDQIIECTEWQPGTIRFDEE